MPERSRVDSKATNFGGLGVIDVDTHLGEPWDLWTSRAPGKWRERVPQVRRQADGKWLWTIDGDREMGAGSAADIDNAQTTKGDERFPRNCPTKARLQVMDEAGIWAQVIYPNTISTIGQRNAWTGREAPPPLDLELRLVATQIYNDAMAEMQSESGDRLLPMALLPWWDIKLALIEAERCATMGLRGVNLDFDPHMHGRQGLAADAWTPLLELCSDKSLPVNFHLAASDGATCSYRDSPWPSLNPKKKLTDASTIMFVSNARMLMTLVLSGLLERHPRLKFVFVESGLGWLPFILKELDNATRGNGSGVKTDLPMSPLEYFRRQVFACFWLEDAELAPTIRKLGVDNCMFETDFPHPDSLYPKTRELADDRLADLTGEEHRKVLSANAARVYQLDLPA